MAKKKAPAVKSGGLRSLSDLTPVTRMEEILNGDDISPVTREEYFVKKAVTTASSELPAVTSSDNGDVLTVVNGAWSKAEAPSGLPEVTAADNGDVLTVVEGSWAKATPGGGLPDYSEASVGDVLTVTEEYVSGETVYSATVSFEDGEASVADLDIFDGVNVGTVLKLTIGDKVFIGPVTSPAPIVKDLGDERDGAYAASNSMTGATFFSYIDSASGTYYTGDYAVKLETVTVEKSADWKPAAAEFYPANGAYFGDLTVAEGAAKLAEGVLVFTYEASGGKLHLLTRVDGDEESDYDVYCDFSNTAVDTGLAGSDILPYSANV